MEKRTRRRDGTAVLLSRAVVDALAEYEGVEPTELSASLYSAIDPDALDALFSPSASHRQAGSIRFLYNGYEVRVSSDGEVHINDS